MNNTYTRMLTTPQLTQALLDLGFTRQEEPTHFTAGQLRIQVLDAPRLRAHSPSGIRYIAVVSTQHLAQQVMALKQN